MTLVVHVTEALGTGVVYSISQLARMQSNDGFEVILVHSRRPETPPPEELDHLFPAPIRRIPIPMVTPVSPLKDVRDVIALAKLFRQLRPDVIHLHSSKAGVLGRLAAFLTGYGKRTFYSPRGFAFLREDVPSVKRALYLIFERIAGSLQGTLVACSGSEAQLARRRVGHARVVLVENSAEFAPIKEAAGSSSARTRVVTSGRLCYQKAPWRFRDLAIRLNDLPVDFVWIGSGELEHFLSASNDHSASVVSTGWLGRDDVLMELSRSDIFVMTSLWEGMPLSLIEAQAAGLPAVVPDVVGCRDVVRHGETGFICKDDNELALRLRELIVNRQLRQTMGRAASKMARERFSVERMHKEMTKVYGVKSRAPKGIESE